LQKEIRTSGYWKINDCDVEYGGDLYINQNKGIIALELYLPNKGSMTSFFTLPYTIDFITGNMATGAKITLINCERYKTNSYIGQKDVFGYTAKFLLNGYCFDSIEKIVFSKVKFRLSNLLEWGKILKYDIKFVEGYEFQLFAKHIDNTLLFSDDNVRISYAIYSNGTPVYPMDEELVFKQEPYIIIESTINQSIDFFIKKLIGMKRIIELAIGVQTDILDIKCEIPEIAQKIGNITIPVEFEVLHHYPRSDSYRKLLGFEFLFNMQDLIENACLVDWFKKYELFEPVLELYVENLCNKDLSINRGFLNIVQSLETYHSRMVCNGTLADYKKHVDKILESVSDAHRERQKDLLLAGCNNNKITLKGRLYDLLLGDFKIHFDTGDIKYTEFPQKISDTRNYLTHYTIKKKDKALHGQSLDDAYIILKTMLEYYIMLELGFNSEFVHKKIKQREKSSRKPREIRALDKKLKTDKKNS
jgi:hypothetical protein